MQDQSTKYSYHLHTRKRFRHQEQNRLKHSVTLHPYVILSTSLTTSFVGTCKFRDSSSCTAVEVATLFTEYVELILILSCSAHGLLSTALSSTNPLKLNNDSSQMVQLVTCRSSSTCHLATIPAAKKKVMITE